MDEEVLPVTAPIPEAKRVRPPLPEALRAYQFKPGERPVGRRPRRVPVADRQAAVAKIVRMADPLGVLCAIAAGEKVLVGGEEDASIAVEVYPSLPDRLTALTVLAKKILPDLKQVSVEDGGQLVNVVLQLGQKVSIETAR